MPDDADAGDQINALLNSGTPWAVVIDGERVPIISLSPGAIAKIQRQFDISWVAICRFPLTFLDAAEATVSAVAAKLGKTDPTPFDDTEELFARFVQVEDDLPSAPVTGDAEENPTGGSSTAG